MTQPEQLDEQETLWLWHELEYGNHAQRREAALTLLETGSPQIREIIDDLNLDRATVNEILDLRPDALKEVMRRLWVFRGNASARGGWPYNQGPLLALLQRGGEAQIATEVLATWGWEDFDEYHQIVELLGEQPERLEVYLTLLDDWKKEAGWHQYAVHTPSGRAAAHAAAEAAAALHP